MKVDFKKALGDSEYIDERYTRIYGQGNYSEKRRKLQKENKNKYILIIVMMIFFIGYCLYEYVDASKGLHVGSGENVISIVKGDKDKSYSFQVIVEKDGNTYLKDVEVKFVEDSGELFEDSSAVSQDDKIDIALEETVRNINNSREKKIVLPAKLEDGSKLYWKEKRKNDGLIYIIFGVMLLGILYKDRYSRLEKEEASAMESVRKELPVFINKIVLLLNAGMVFQSAFLKIVDEHRKFNCDKQNYFYCQLYIISDNVKSRNFNVHKELENFAKRTRIKEFVRVSGIISDNIYKGVDLTDKLENEGEQLWFNHKKQMEERGRLAETKLVAPLALLLMILVLITVAPAMLEM